MCTRKELDLILQQMLRIYRSVYGSEIVRVILYGSYARGENQSEELELKYGTIVSPTVIPFGEFEKYKNDLPYYRNTETEGEEIVA